MRVAYITTYNADEVKHWSGTGYFIAEGLKNQGVELIKVNCQVNYTFFQRLRRKIQKTLFKRELLLEREPAYLKMVAKKATKQLSGKEFDLIFSPSSLPITYLKSRKPIVFFTDATYDCLMKLYLQGKRLSNKSIIDGNKAEAIALQNAALVFYTSEWAIKSAINKYKVEPKKLRQSTIGANLLNINSEKHIRTLIYKRVQSETKNLLFIGVDWYRKGAKKAIETAARLNSRGFQITITLVGCTIPKEEILPDFVQHYPFISKESAEGKIVLDRLFEQATFFVLPTIADCTPVVFAEAAAYGLPVITTTTGGCPSVVMDKVTGFCIDIDQFEQEASEIMIKLLSDEKAYERISLNAYYHYCNNLNWNEISKKILTSLEPFIEKT